MKLTSLLTIALAASSLVFTACDKKEGGGTTSSGGGGAAVSEADAIARIKKQATEIKEWADKNKPAADNPMAGLAMIDTMVAKMKAVDTSGAPADLKKAIDDMNAVLAKMAAIVKDLPKDAAAMQTYIMDKAKADPGFMTKFQADMESVGKEMETAGNNLKEVSKKHGIDFDIDKK